MFSGSELPHGEKGSGTDLPIFAWFLWIRDAVIEAVARTGLRGLHSAHSFKVEMPDLCCWLGVLFGTSLDESVLVCSNCSIQSCPAWIMYEYDVTYWRSSLSSWKSIIHRWFMKNHIFSKVFQCFPSSDFERNHQVLQLPTMASWPLWPLLSPAMWICWERRPRPKMRWRDTQPLSTNGNRWSQIEHR